jgi:hypothetical protein
MADIFFSYVAEDAARVAQIVQALRAKGLDIDADRTVLAGQNFVSEMSRRLAEAQAVVVVWSSRSISSAQVLDEASAARDQGKLVPVRIDAVEAPLGFRQLQSADLSGPNVAGGMAALATALAAIQGATLRPVSGKGPPLTAFAEPTSGDVLEDAPRERFLRSRSFWIWTAGIAAFSGLLYFISPLGQSEMGGDAATRIGAMIGNVLGAFLVVAVSQALIHVSRGWVGKRQTRFLNIEFLSLVAIGAVLGLVNMTDPASVADSGGGVMGVAHQANFTALGSLLIFSPVLALVRGVMRLASKGPARA